MQQTALRKLWESRRLQLDRAVQDDWLEWMRHLSVELLRESPSPALRACAPGRADARAVGAPPLQRWLHGLLGRARGRIVREPRRGHRGGPHCAVHAYRGLQELLALAEYMERHDEICRSNIRMLGDIATKCGSYSKALHYRELEYQTISSARSSPRLVEALVSLHRSLGQPEAAIGVLTYAQQRQDFTVKLSWLEKLGRWQDALSYERAQPAEPRAGDYALGRLAVPLGALRMAAARACVRPRGQTWARGSSWRRRAASPPPAGTASSGMASPRLSGLIEPTQYDGGFFRAIPPFTRRALRRPPALDRRGARGALQPELTPLANESYSRVYDHLVQAQQLSELEELIEYKLCKRVLVLQAESAGTSAVEGQHPPRGGLGRRLRGLLRARETCDGIRQRWLSRLRVCARELRVWQPMVELRAMALSRTSRKTWIKFASLCRKSGRLELTRTSLSKLLPRGSPLSTLPVHQLAASSLRPDGRVHARAALRVFQVPVGERRAPCGHQAARAAA